MTVAIVRQTKFSLGSCSFAVPVYVYRCTKSNRQEWLFEYGSSESNFDYRAVARPVIVNMYINLHKFSVVDTLII